ncbi:unnamed protein product, partial [Laminaria digitata]
RVGCGHGPVRFFCYFVASGERGRQLKLTRQEAASATSATIAERDAATATAATAATTAAAATAAAADSSELALATPAASRATSMASRFAQERDTAKWERDRADSL